MPSRSLLALWTVQLAASGASHLALVASGVWLVERGGAGRYAWLTAATLIPQAITLPLGGALADRVGARAVLVSCQLASLALAGVAWGLAGSGVPHRAGGVAVLVVLLSLVYSIAWPSLLATITSVVAAPERAFANAALATGDLVVRAAASALAGALVLGRGIGAAFAVAGAIATVGVGAASLLRVPQPSRVAPQAASVYSGRGGRPPGERSGSVTEGARYLVRDATMRRVLVVRAVLRGAIAAFEVLVLPLALVLASGSARGITVVYVAAGGGMLVAFVIGRRASSALLGHALRGGAPVMGLALLAAAIAPSLAVLAAATLVTWASFLTFGACEQATWQAIVPRAVQGRVFAAQRLVTGLSIPAVLLAIGPILSASSEGHALSAPRDAGSLAAARIVLAALGLLGLASGALVRRLDLSHAPLPASPFPASPPLTQDTP